MAQGQRGGAEYPCRMTSWSLKQTPREFGLLNELATFVGEAWSKSILHIQHSIQFEKATEDTHSEYVMKTRRGLTPFTTITVNKSWRTAAHIDKGDLKQGFGAMCCFGDRLRNDHSLARTMEFPKGREPQSFWRMNAVNLIDENLAWQHRDFADKNAKQPRVSSAWIEQLERLGFDPCLYLEEVDKVRADKTKLDILFDTINALYNYKGVLLLNSNLTKQEFANQFGPEFARRIGEMCNVVDCFAQEIKLCSVLAKEAQ